MIDVIVVGGGPAGLTASSYLRRFHRSCLVLDAGDSRARWIPESNNCPGFPQGVSGDALLRRLRDQAAAVDVAVEEARVDAIVPRGEGFEVRAGERSWEARKVILATGVSDRLPEGAWVEAAVASHALRLCPICDAYEASDLGIGVYGPSAGIGSHARFLRAYSESVHALPTDTGDGASRAEGARGRRALVARGGQLAFDGRRCTYLPPGADEPIAFDTVYAYLGRHQRREIAAAPGSNSPTRGDHRRRAPADAPAGLYAIGDIVSGLNQISVAVGHAAIAATHAHNALPFVARAPREA